MADQAGTSISRRDLLRVAGAGVAGLGVDPASLPAAIRYHDDNHVTTGHVIPSLELVVVRQGNQNRQMGDEPNFANELIQKIVAALPGTDV